jgi:rubrerythrin
MMPLMKRDSIYRKKIKRIRCATCGKKKDLVIHHISGNLQNNNVSNLIVLCNSCHMKLHSSIKRKFNKQYCCPYCDHVWIAKTKTPKRCPGCQHWLTLLPSNFHDEKIKIHKKNLQNELTRRLPSATGYENRIDAHIKTYLVKCVKCKYAWQARTKAPKACPRCKRRFDYEVKKKK